MEAVRPKSKGKAKKKTKSAEVKTRDKHKQEPASSSDGASVSVAAATVVTEMVKQPTPKVDKPVEQDPEPVSTGPVEADGKDEKTERETERDEKELGKGIEAETGLTGLEPATGGLSEPVPVSEDLIQLYPGEDGEEEPVRSKLQKQEKPVSEVDEQVSEGASAVQGATPSISGERTSQDTVAQEQLTNETVPNLVTEKVSNLKIESDLPVVEQAEFGRVSNQITETNALTNQIVVPSAPAELVVTETSQLVTVDMLPPQVAMETAVGPMYPTLDSLTVQQELMEDLTPFSEEDLALLYPNRQLEARAVFEDSFIMEARQERHELYELLSLYLKSRLGLSTAQAHLQALKNDYNTYKPLLWKMETQSITSSAKCGDNVKVNHDHSYEMAVFDPEAAVQFNTALTKIREVLQEELCMKSYSSQLARIHAEHYLTQLINSLPLLSQLPQDAGCTSWIPQVPPGGLDGHASHIRDAISVLFVFERRPPRDEQFTKDCRQWLNMLISALLRVATLSDHLFIQHHLLRCPPGVSEWAVSYLQVASPLSTDHVLTAQFGQRDQSYAYDWGVGMGLHQDWGGPLLDYFVTALATLLLPIKQREEFLVALHIPLATGGEGDARQRWTFVDEDLEEGAEEDQVLLKETDFISFFDQFPFSEMFQHILQIGPNGEMPVAEATSHQILRLIAFATCLIRLLGAAFSTLRLARYKEFVKQVGRTIRQTVQYVADNWSMYKSHRLTDGDTMSSLPQTSLEAAGQARYSLNRLQLEFDQFVLRATRWILTAHKLGAWQFLADMPYNTVSLSALWNIFYSLYSNQMRPVSDWSASGSGEGGGGGGARETISDSGQVLPTTAAEIISALKDPTHKDQFTDMLMKTYTSEAVFLLTTFVNMARARPSDCDPERQFISTVTLEIFEVTQVMEFACDAYSHTGCSLLDSIAIVHPFVISILIGRISEVIDRVGENCISVVKELPLNIWTPTPGDLSHAHQWLVGTPLPSATNKLARVMLGELNWGRKTEDGSNDLVLDWWTHRAVALMVAEAHSVLLPYHPGGRDFTSIQSSISKYTSTLQKLTMSQEEKDFVSWAWEVLLMLKLHPNQVIVNSMEILTPERSTSPRDRTMSTSAKDPAVYRRRSEPDWAKLSPDSDRLILPDLTNSSERELAELRDAVRYEGILAAYVALCLTSLGTDTDHFLLGGLPLLHRLINEGYFLPALRIIANVTPRFFKHKKILLEVPSFLQAVITVANADSANTSLRDRMTFVTPQPQLLRKMAGLLHTQLQSGRGQRGGVSGDVVLHFWLHVLLSYPGWHKEQSLLYLLNSLCLAAFSELSWHKILIDALLEAYRTLGPLYARRSLLSPVWSIMGQAGPPSIFASVSVKELPWLAFFALCAEQMFEEKEKIWKELLKQLKKDSKMHIDNALKKAFAELKTPPGTFSSVSLSIYRWAEFCSSMEPGHPIMPLVWQKFFSLYLQRPVLENEMPERGSLGLRFFSQSRANSQRRQMKSCLSATCMKLQSQIDKSRRESESERAGQGEDEESVKEYLPKALSLYQTLNLWLDEPRLHDSSLYLPGLPPQYNSQRLSTVFSPSQLWMEFVPLWEVKAQQVILVEEWLKVESYQKTLPSHTPKSTPDNAMTRIQKRLKRRKDPKAPPTLQLSHTPFEYMTEEILLSQEALLAVLKSDIQFVVHQASSFCMRYTTLATLDTQYMDGVPEHYSNEPRQFHVRTGCQSRFNRSHKCLRPATIVFRFHEAQLNPKWEQQLAVNRSEYDQVTASLALPLSHDLCKAVMRMEHTVSELSRLSECLPETEKVLAVRSGVALFYEILSSLNRDCRQFPPTCQFLTSCVQILGQEFIQRDPSQTLHILECLLSQPSKADLLAPLFNPNNCPEQFLQMYSNMEIVAGKEGPNVAFSVMTKFNVPQWLDAFSPSLSDRCILLDYVWRGLVLCGPSPSLEFEILLETYKHHLIQTVDYQFPDLLNDFLRLMVEATDNATVVPNLWTNVTSTLTLSKEHPEDCRLGLQQCKDIAAFFSQHYMTKRTVVKETLYSLVSWDYIPELGKFLHLLCHTLVCKWEDAVSMGTTTHQTALVECWKCIVDVFAPWTSSVQLSSENTHPQSPCTDSESGIMGTAMEYFVESVHSAHNALKDPGQQYSILALQWEYYCSTLSLPAPPSAVLRVYHAHLVNLPWGDYFPDLAAVEAMMKLKLMDYYNPASFIFLGSIFPKISWKTIVAAYCNVSLHGNPEAPIQLHVMLLQLLVMLAAENDVMKKQETHIPETMAEAQDFNWHFIDAKTYQDILDWQKSHCDPGMVLQTGTCLSLSLRLMKAAAGFPSSDGTRQQLHEETWQKRHSYVETVVWLISQASKKKELHSANYSDAISHLFQTALDLCMQEPSEQNGGHIIQLLQNILGVFNTCSPAESVRQKILDIVLLILDQMPDIHYLSLPVLSASCRSLVDITILVKISEKAIQTHFNILPKPSSEILDLKHDPNGYGWHGVTSYLSLPQAKKEEVCQVCIAECAGLVLHGHLLQALPQSTTLQQEYRIAAKIVQWCTQLKPKPAQEAKVFLLWEKAINLLLRQVRFGGNYLEVVPHFTALATCLTRLGEDKASEGLLGVIGLGKKSSYSHQFRLISRAIAAHLYCQMPVDGSQKTELRVVPNAPGHVKDPSRPTQKGSLTANTIVPTKLGDSSFHSLESLLTNKHYSHLKEKVSWCVGFVGDPTNCVMSTDQLLVELCTSLYLNHRFLDILRVFQRT